MPKDWDLITLPASGNIGASQVSIHVSAELMKNQQKASPIEATQNLAVVTDDSGKPMLFSIGTDHRFHLIRFDSTAQTGWTAIDLQAGFKGYTAATAFAVSQDLKGNISVLVALRAAGAPGTDLFMANKLPPTTDWTTLATLAHKITGVDARFAAEKMLMGASDDGQAPLVVATGPLAGEQYYYLVDGAAGTAARVEFPQDVVDKGAMQDLSIGYAFGQRGIYFLYKIGESQTLECTTLPSPDQGTMHYDYSPGNQKLPEPLRNLRYNCIATPTGSQNDPYTICSDIYVGTDQGIYLFRNAHADSLQLVTDQVKEVHEITVTQDGQNISIWAMASPNKLSYIYGKKGGTYTWHTPVLFSETAIQMCPIRSQARQANELFVVCQDQSITQYWQDPASTLWQQRAIRVPDQADMTEFNSYTTHIHLQDELGRPLANQTVNLTASDWTYAEANGLIYSLDKRTPAAVQTDIMGNVTVIVSTVDISVPILHMDADFLNKTLNIYPNGKVHKGIAAIQTGADLKAATTKGGAPVLSQNLDQATLDGVAANLSQLSGAASQSMGLPANNTFVAVTDKAVKQTGKLCVDHFPNDFAMGMQVSGGAWRPLASVSPLLAANGVGGIAGDIVDFGGDLLKEIENIFEKGLSMVKDGVTYLQDGASFVIKKVEDGLMLVLSLADKVLNVVLNTLGSVFQAASWLLKQIGIDLEKILAWLGHLFGWTDILETSDKIVDVANSWLNGLVKGLPALAATVDSAITSLEKKVADPSIVASFGESGSSKASGGDSSTFQNPAANWPLYHILHGDWLSGGQTDLDSDIVSQIAGTVTQLLSTELFTAETGARDLLQALADGISNMSLGDMFKKILEIIAVMALEGIKGAADAVFKLGAVLVQGLIRMLNYEVHIPILSTLLKPFLGGRELTLMRVFAVVLAIPVRVVHLILKGTSFSNDDLTFPADFDLGTLAAEAMRPQVLLATNALAASAQPAEEPADIPFGLVLLYEVSRFAGMIFSDLNLAAYLTTETDGLAATSLLEIFCTVQALGMVAANWMIVRNHGITYPPSWAQYTMMSLTALVLLLKVIGRKPEWKVWSRGGAIAAYCTTIVVQGIDFSTNTHDRSTSLKFTSDLFTNIWNGISSFPTKVSNPYVVAGIVAANSLAALTHISLVGARYKTDGDDRAQFMLS